MNLTINIFTALRALRRNKMRSALTSIGIIIGISSVIAMIGLGSSAKIAVRDKITSYGKNAVFISMQKGKKFNPKDLDEIRRLMPQIKYVSPAMYISEKNDARSIHSYRDKKHRARVIFASEDYFPLQDRYAARGRLFNDREIQSFDKVCVIGKTVADNLFITDDPLDKMIMIKNTTYRVIGILDYKGEAIGGEDFDNYTIIPYTIGHQRFYNTNKFKSLYVSVENDADVPQLQKILTEYCKQRFSIVGDIQNQVKMTTSQDKVKVADEITGLLSILLAGIASISLFVGGVGIMNIMLVSVTERTREIGIRMAIGAKKKDIMIQFLLEATVLSGLGGICGVILGITIYFIITIVAKWPFIFSLFSVFISVIFAGAVGIFFGYYPSKKASDLKPIDALRYE